MVKKLTPNRLRPNESRRTIHEWKFHMKKLHIAASTAAIVFGVIAGVAGSALLNPASAHAEYSWVADESAAICNSLSLVNSGYSDFGTTEILRLQLVQDVGRAEAVTGIRQAATSYCPQYLSAVPAR
jgi:hypothetical protein